MNPFLTEINKKGETKIFKVQKVIFTLELYIDLIKLIFTKFFVYRSLFRNWIHTMFDF